MSHAGRITAPRGWELVRHAGPLPSHPDEDDLIALAEAVREGREAPIGGIAAGFTDPVTGAHGGALMAPPARRPESTGRRRGHLRVLPDPSGLSRRRTDRLAPSSQLCKEIYVPARRGSPPRHQGV